MPTTELVSIAIFSEDFNIDSFKTGPCNELLDFLLSGTSINNETYLCFLLAREAHIALADVLLNGISFIDPGGVLIETHPRELTTELNTFPQTKVFILVGLYVLQLQLVEWVWY